MKDRVRKRILALILMVAFMTPALSLFNVKDILPLAGFQSLDVIPSLSFANLKTRKYQTAVERRFAKTFFLRSFLYRLRCQAMELPNLGVYHEGKAQDLGQYADGTLFSFGDYFNCYVNPRFGPLEENFGKSLDTIANLRAVLASNGVDMVFVMAADKVQMTKKPLSWLTSALFRRNHEEFQTGYVRHLSSRGIPCFDAYSFLTNEAPRHAESLFPYTGIHWNALGASLVVDELLTRLNRKSDRPYAINRIVGVEETDIRPAPYRDEDIGRLLNLLYNPYLKKNKCYLPTFEHDDFTPNEGGVIVFGDSFTWEIAESLRRSRDFEPGKVLDFDKRVPRAADLMRLGADLRLVIIVYMSPHMLELDKRSYIRNTISPFCKLVNERVATHQVAIGEPITFNAGNGNWYKYFRCGISTPEANWTWTDGHEAVMRFRTASDAPRLSVQIRCASFHHRQHVTVSTGGLAVFDDVCGDGGIEFTFENPGAGKDIELTFNFPEAISPASLGNPNDPRLLALRLRSIVVSER